MMFWDLNMGLGLSGIIEYDLYIDVSCLCKFIVLFYVDIYEVLIMLVFVVILYFKIYLLWCVNKLFCYIL